MHELVKVPFSGVVFDPLFERFAILRSHVAKCQQRIELRQHILADCCYALVDEGDANTTVATHDDKIADGVERFAECAKHTLGDELMRLLNEDMAGDVVDIKEFFRKLGDQMTLGHFEHAKRRDDARNILLYDRMSRRPR